VLALRDERAHGVYYLSDGRAHSWQNIGQLIGRALGIRVREIRFPMFLAKLAAAVGEVSAHLGGRPPLISFGKIRELQQRCWVCLPEKATREFGFTPLIGIEEGMEETVRWYRNAGWLQRPR
jgi:nucleoside-diphosphate-sugar epimerase